VDGLYFMGLANKCLRTLVKDSKIETIDNFYVKKLIFYILMC